MARKRIKKLSYFELILILIIFLLAFFIFFSKIEIPIQFLPEVSTSGYEQVSISLDLEEDKGIVKFYSGCYELSMTIEKSQAISIINGENKVRYFRPLTHDLAADILENYGIKILMVKITEIQNNTYFARLILRQGNKILSLDSRPSDALALAARTDYLVPVYVKEEILENFSKKIC